MPIREVSDRFYGKQDTTPNPLGEAIVGDLMSRMDQSRKEKQLSEAIREILSETNPSFSSLPPERQERLSMAHARAGGSGQLSSAMGNFGEVFKRQESQRLQDEQADAYGPLFQAVGPRAIDVGEHDWMKTARATPPGQLGQFLGQLLGLDQRRRESAEGSRQFDERQKLYRERMGADTGMTAPATASPKVDTKKRDQVVMMKIKDAEKAIERIQNDELPTGLADHVARLVEMGRPRAAILRELEAVFRDKLEQLRNEYQTSSQVEEGSPSTQDQSDPLGILE